jgi:hypothetical protein
MLPILAGCSTINFRIVDLGINDHIFLLTAASLSSAE